MLLVLAMILQPLKGKSVQQPWNTHSKASDIGKAKRNPSPTSTFTFLNQSEIAKGLDYLKKKYPDVDWSAVSPTSSKREFGKENSLKQVKRTSSFVFLNQSEIAKGLDYLKKKYPDVDWSAVTSTGKRELKSNSIERKADEEKRSFQDPSIQQRNDISEVTEGFTSSLEFPGPEKRMERLEYLEQSPEVDWSALKEEALAE